MGAHRASDKCDEGALGPLTETVQWTRLHGVPAAETTLQTMGRGAREELLVNDPNTLGFMALKAGGWFLDKVPVGKNYPGQYTLAICAVVHMPTAAAEQLVDGFAGSQELASLTLMKPPEIAASTRLRTLAEDILAGVFQRGLHIRPSRERLTPVIMPSSPELIDPTDNIPPRSLSLVK